MKAASPLELSRIRTLPLEERRSLARVEDILIPPEQASVELSPTLRGQITACAQAVCRARQAGAAVILMYGAHLLRNGAALILGEMLKDGWITHLATNGAGSIHDWEYAWLGRSTESVEENVANGTFGTWEETGRNIHLALMGGLLAGEGYGRAVGRFIHDDGVTLPNLQELERSLRENPVDPLSSVRAEILTAMHRHNISSGRIEVEHRLKHASILATAFRHSVPVTVHPGIGYDIISCHPMFNGSIIGRAAELDFKLFAGAVDKLDHGVVLSIGSAIMAPQVFEKSLSCVHNIRFQDGRSAVHDFDIFVVDLQDGGGWDWRQGEPPKSHPAYYLRFCKSFSRMGGAMHYVQCDNVAFVHHLFHALRRS